jgi:hypothetical protein
MIAALEEKRVQLTDLCCRFYVRRLDLFGSAVADERFNSDESDLDFLVEFEPTEAMNPADQYFGLWEDLNVLFCRDVDLVTVRSLRNPYFIRSVNATRQVLYER